MASGRVPSWKAVAIAVLKNDHKLQSLGFSCRQSHFAESLYKASKHVECEQMEFPGFCTSTKSARM